MKRDLLVLPAFVAATFCAPLTGLLYPPDDWYANLDKPAWTPPGWVFGPVWTTLYLMMSVAAWLVWRRDGWRKPMFLYLLQLSLNAAWTPLFFGLRAPGWALLDIIALWITVLLTLRSFYRFSKPAGWLLVPYLGWISFASFLNYTLWRLQAIN